MPSQSTPTVSILVAAYKAHGTIRLSIESALAQSYPHIEVIVAPDDGSTYSEIWQWCSDPRVRILQPPAETGTGPANARNRAIEASRGEFLCVLDADDYISRGYIEALIKIAAKDGMAAASMRYVSEGGTLVRAPEMPTGLLTVTGFGQLLCSLKPIAHRSLDTGFCPVFAEDVLYDAILLSMAGGARIAPGEFYNTVLHPKSICAASDEGCIAKEYELLALGVVSNPASVRAQALGLHARREVAELFKFRAFVSRRFAERSDCSTGYHEFVRNRESALWDEFTSQSLQA